MNELSDSWHVLYLLDGHTPVPTEDMFAVEELLKNVKARRVGLDTIDGVDISTVFLCINHGLDGSRKGPVLFETLFNYCDEDYIWRYGTWEEAEAGHQKAIDLVKSKHP